jgi:hypothetical protein
VRSLQDVLGVLFFSQVLQSKLLKLEQVDVELGVVGLTETVLLRVRLEVILLFLQLNEGLPQEDLEDVDLLLEACNLHGVNVVVHIGEVKLELLVDILWGLLG